MWRRLEGKPMSFAKAGPNTALHLTASSLCSFLVPASGGR
jgi:hypothetical protein